MGKDKHGKGNSDDWKREAEAITTYNCASDGHRYERVPDTMLEQCKQCGAVRAI